MLLGLFLWLHSAIGFIPLASQCYWVHSSGFLLHIAIGFIPLAFTVLLGSFLWLHSAIGFILLAYIVFGQQRDPPVRGAGYEPAI